MFSGKNKIFKGGGTRLQKFQILYFKKHPIVLYSVPSCYENHLTGSSWRARHCVAHPVVYRDENRVLPRLLFFFYIIQILWPRRRRLILSKWAEILGGLFFSREEPIFILALVKFRSRETNVPTTHMYCTYISSAWGIHRNCLREELNCFIKKLEGF